MTGRVTDGQTLRVEELGELGGDLETSSGSVWVSGLDDVGSLASAIWLLLRRCVT